MKDFFKKENNEIRQELERKIAFLNLEYGCLKDRYDVLVKNNGELKKEIEELKSELKKWKPRPVEQYTLEGEYIQTFDTTSKAAKAMYGFPSCIRKALSGSLKTAYGYKWKYAKGDINE